MKWKLAVCLTYVHCDRFDAASLICRSTDGQTDRQIDSMPNKMTCALILFESIREGKSNAMDRSFLRSMRRNIQKYLCI